jgi:hypothetical protein
MINLLPVSATTTKSGVKDESFHIKNSVLDAKDDLENFYLKKQLDETKERLSYLESINQSEEWTYTTLCDIQAKTVPIRCVINTRERKIIYSEVDIEYMQRKKQESRDRERNRRQNK